jgi:hypothetical protein
MIVDVHTHSPTHADTVPADEIKSAPIDRVFVRTAINQCLFVGGG